MFVKSQIGLRGKSEYRLARYYPKGLKMTPTTKSHFPILILIVDSGEKTVIKKPEDVPQGKSFSRFGDMSP